MMTNSILSERKCNVIEYWIRRLFSSFVYFRIYRKLYPEKPFYSPSAIRKIESLLNTNSRVFEWGSGISTIWYAKRVKELVSIEHDKTWFESTYW